MNVLKGLLVILVSGSSVCEAILSGGQSNNNQTEIGNKSTDSQITNSFKVDGTTPNTETNNNTFYYEANTFLLNKKSDQSTAQVKRDSPEERKSSGSSVEPASIGSTSARNGRMLDLDALVGDFAASQTIKARSQTGNRQSRFLPSSRTLEVGNGKKLHIQGFIPIVGIKDVTNDELGGGDFDQDQLLLQQQQLSPSNKKNAEELPYAQSSIGHASFITPQQVTSQVDAKFSGAAAVVDTFRKPLRKLMRYGETQQQQQQQQQQHGSNSIQRLQAGCLCVPFYMCKNGFISESSLGGSHLQQMIHGQQATYPSATTLQAQAKAAQLMIAPAPKAMDSYTQTASNQASQFATLSAQVDERSLERDIITLAPLIGSTDEQQTANSLNQTSDASEAQPSLVANNFESDAVNSTGSELNQANDYSQEILGRMLGIKSTLGGSKPSSADASNGVCGLLRTCCQIPAHLVPGGQHQDYLAADSNVAAQSQMSFSGSSSIHPVTSVNRYPFRQQQTNQLDMTTRPTEQRQPMGSLQKYQQQSTNALQRGTPYGFPSMQVSRFEPLNNPDQLAMMNTALAHRSNMFPQTTNRFQVMASSQPGDYKRAPQQMQYVPSMQQQQPTSLSLSHHAAMSPANAIDQQSISANRMATPGSANGLYQSQALNEALGTRKILEGRCGLRQSAGINGRVQNLQYQENSAEFGEYPAQAAILKRITGTDSMFVCGGTLISQYWIATAAHCIKKHSISDLKVRLGEWDVHRDDEFYPYVEKGIRDLVVHSEFVPGNLVNDIALLRLDSPVDASLPHVNPACLPTIDESFSGQKCWVTGWGKDSFGQKGTFQTVLQEVELPIVGQAECESALKQTRLGPHYRLHSGFICAGGEGGKDACEGDGGSGLYCMQDGLIKVAGLVSWGIGCGQQGVPGVYVNLAHYRPWIENIISIDEDIYSRNSNSTVEMDKTTTTSV